MQTLQGFLLTSFQLLVTAISATKNYFFTTLFHTFSPGFNGDTTIETCVAEGFVVSVILRDGQKPFASNKRHHVGF